MPTWAGRSCHPARAIYGRDCPRTPCRPPPAPVRISPHCQWPPPISWSPFGHSGQIPCRSARPRTLCRPLPPPAMSARPHPCPQPCRRHRIPILIYLSARRARKACGPLSQCKRCRQDPPPANRSRRCQSRTPTPVGSAAAWRPGGRQGHFWVAHPPVGRTHGKPPVSRRK